MPWTTALALRVAASVALAERCRMASGLRLAGEQPMVMVRPRREN